MSQVPGVKRSVRERLGWLPVLVALVISIVALAASCTPSQPHYGAHGGGPANDVDGGGCVGPTCPEVCAAHPAPGCACSLEGQHLLCAKAEATYPAEPPSNMPVTVCGTGFSVCSNGVWSECQITGAKVAPGAPPGFYVEGLGLDAGACANPCDPTCLDFNDTPNGLDAGSGLVATDAGLTIGGNSTGPCIPKSCATLNATCGIQGDGCGNTFDCGSCPMYQTCGGGGVPNKCGSSCTKNYCANLAASCPGNGNTSISGTVYMPNGTTPIPNVIVYVPNISPPGVYPPALSPFTAQVACVTAGNCTAEVSGEPLVATTTKVDGTFKLTGVPAGVAFPVVIQLGRFRRVFQMPAVTACTNAVVSCSSPDTCLSRFPRVQNETTIYDNIPKMAFSTGCVDGLECVWLKAGISVNEFTAGNTTGRVNLYLGAGCYGTYLGSGGNAWDTTFLGDSTLMSKYDMILFPCQGAQYLYVDAPTQQTYEANIAGYANAGGRVFATHYSYIWLISGGNYLSPFNTTSPPFNWDVDQNYNGPDPTNGVINTSITGGQTLAQWLQVVGASTTYGQMNINTIRHDFDSVNPPSSLYVSLPYCTATTSDPHNCGACGTTCSGAKPYCSNGACAASCGGGLTTCGKACVNTNTDPNHCGSCSNVCGAGETCVSGTCTCGSASDPNNCGGCGVVCGVGQQCVGGTCSCPAGTAACGGSCVSTMKDPNNCGGCGTKCTTGQTCVGGACACPAGTTACGGSCVSFATDPNNCGGCGTKCAAGQVCAGSACSCPAGTTACGGTCVTTGTDPNNCGGCGVACVAGQVCSGGTCGCPAGTTACGGTCMDTTTNPANCGTCGHACLAGQTCAGGVCSCGAGSTLCGGKCITTADDPNNCGGCGVVCSGGGKQCLNGACTCPTGYTTVCGGTCTNTSTNPNNCGSCGHVCSGATPECLNGACVASTTSCGGTGTARCTVGSQYSCVNTKTDLGNCGACGTKCGNGQICSGSACVCMSGTTSCSGACVPTSTDPNNCGSCGKVCAAGFTCVSGTCTIETGYTNCSGVAVKITSDPKNCGSCGKTCNAGFSCSASACAIETGYTNCSGTVKNLSSDPKNCGSCGKTCAAGAACTGGVCTPQNSGTLCSGVVVSLQTDPKNCGSCGKACPGGSTCVAGVCTPETGYSVCGASVRDLANDPKNCGSCGTACTAGETCNNGACACFSGYTACNGTCFDLKNDPNNCGACGYTCGPGQGCVNGACSCGTGSSNCSIPMQASFNTPVGGAANSQCGRVVYSDFHVESSSNTQFAFPNECPGITCSGGQCTGPLTPQEFMLAQSLFDLAGCVAQQPMGPPCIAATCAQLGVNCGTAGDGCGGTLNCGACTAPATCGGGGMPNVCGVAQTYSPVPFIRDYTATCAQGSVPVWRTYSWSALTPADSHIDFQIATATTLAGLATAPAFPLGWSAPPGVPVGLSAGAASSAHAAGQPAGTPDTELGSASPDATLKANSLQQNNAYLRVIATLVPSTGGTSAPTLASWDMQIDCVPSM